MSVSLSDSERHYFRLLAETIYTNPFAIDRAEIERRFGAGVPRPPSEHHFSAIAPSLDSHLETLRQRGLERLQQLGPADHALLRHARCSRPTTAAWTLSTDSSSGSWPMPDSPSRYPSPRRSSTT